MAVYNIDDITPSTVLQNGDTIECPYSGTVKSVNLPRGEYKFECWGAKGGDTSKPDGSKKHAEGAQGGYAVGQKYIGDDTTLYLVCGEKGQSTKEESNRRTFNGGGRGGHCGKTVLGVTRMSIFPSGGGATHVATAPGELASLSSNRNSILLVAGGGAQKGLAYDKGGTKADAKGGGDSGGNAGWSSYQEENSEYDESSADFVRYSTGGTQRAGGTGAICHLVATDRDQQGSDGSFGQGGDGSHYNSEISGPGGGGGWYGGGGGAADYYYSMIGLFIYINNVAIGAGAGSGHVGSAMPGGSTYNGEYVTNPDTEKNGHIRITAVSIGARFDIVHNDRTIAVATVSSAQDIVYNGEAIATLRYDSTGIRIKCGKQKCLTDINVGNIRIKTGGKLARTDILIRPQ